MNDKNKRINITLTLLYILLILLIALFYFIYSNNFYNSLTINYVSQNQDVFSNELNGKINNLFDEASKNYLYKGEIKDNHIHYLDNKINLDENYLKDYQIGFIEDYIYIYEDHKFYIYSIDKIIKNIENITTSKNILLMDNQGYIYYATNDIGTNLISQYLDKDASDDFKNYISYNKNTVIKNKINNKEAYLSLTSIKDYDDLYLVEVYDDSFIRPIHKQYDRFFLLFLITTTAIVIVTQTYIFRSVHIKNAEIESSRFTYLYAKPYVIKINRKGKIIGCNKKVKREVKHYEKFHHIEELNITDKPRGTQPQILLKKEESFTVSFPNKAIRFIPLKSSRHYYLVGEDITDLESNFSEMHALAYYDEVTTLPNFNFFKNEVNKIIKNSEYNPKTTAAIIFDIDGFTAINKVFGPSNANILLYQLGNILSNFAKELNGIVYNPEHDKFIILTTDYKKQEDIIELVKDIQIYLEKPIEVVGNKIKVYLHTGIFYFDTNPEELLTAKRVYAKLLDTLTRAKESSIHNYIVYDEALKLYVSQQNLMAQDLIKAIRKDELTVYLQPQYDSVNKRISGFEALLRWDNPKYINVSPEKYIKIAEHNNLIVDIGKNIIEKSFAMAEKLKKYNVSISINISPVQIMQEGFVDEFLEMFKKYNLPKESITIEITETFLMTSFKVVNAKLRILRKEGIKIHLDDFGTGYSSLPYVKELSIDAIKIDRSFIRHIETDKKDREIVNMLLTLSKNLELDVIAEGVENKKQKEYLNKRGCNTIQGFILSPAVKIEEAIELLEQYNVEKSKILE